MPIYDIKNLNGNKNNTRVIKYLNQEPGSALKPVRTKALVVNMYEFIKQGTDSDPYFLLSQDSDPGPGF